jgi:hypothetical protein
MGLWQFETRSGVALIQMEERQGIPRVQSITECRGPVRAGGNLLGLTCYVSNPDIERQHS